MLVVFLIDWYWLFFTYLFYYYWGLSDLLSWTWSFPSYSCFHVFPSWNLFFCSLIVETVLSVWYSFKYRLQCWLDGHELPQFVLEMSIALSILKDSFPGDNTFVSWLFSGLAMCHSTLSWHLGLLSWWSHVILMVLLCRWVHVFPL